MLENDAEAMIAIASAAQADFVRIKIYVGAMMTPFGVETAQAHRGDQGAHRVGAPTTSRSSPTSMIAPARRSRAAASRKTSSSLCGSAAADGLVLTGKTLPRDAAN